LCSDFCVDRECGIEADEGIGFMGGRVALVLVESSPDDWCVTVAFRILSTVRFVGALELGCRPCSIDSLPEKFEGFRGPRLGRRSRSRSESDWGMLEGAATSSACLAAFSFERERPGSQLVSDNLLLWPYQTRVNCRRQLATKTLTSGLVFITTWIPAEKKPDLVGGAF
jgi:hypothetical protein